MNNICLLAILMFFFTATAHQAECTCYDYGEQPLQSDYIGTQITYHQYDELSTAKLFNTIVNNDYETAKYLIAQGNADPNAQIDGGFTPLHMAVFLHRIKIVQVLLEHPATNRNITNESGLTPLQMAQTLGYHDIISLFCKRSAYDSTDAAMDGEIASHPQKRVKLQDYQACGATKGVGVEKVNPQKAVEWFQAAAKQDCPRARDALRRLEFKEKLRNNYNSMSEQIWLHIIL